MRTETADRVFFSFGTATGNRLAAVATIAPMVSVPWPLRSDVSESHRSAASHRACGAYTATKRPKSLISIARVTREQPHAQHTLQVLQDLRRRQLPEAHCHCCLPPAACRLPPTTYRLPPSAFRRLLVRAIASMRRRCSSLKRPTRRRGARSAASSSASSLQKTIAFQISKFHQN